MSVSAKSPRRGRIAFVSLLLTVATAALLIPARSDATRPVVPAGDGSADCPATGPELRVKAPAKPVQAPSTVRLRARVGAAGSDACFDIPMRICVRVGKRAKHDLRVRRACFRRGTDGARLSEKAVFMIRVRRRAKGTYRVVVRAVPIRPALPYRLILAPRATARLTVVGR